MRFKPVIAVLLGLFGLACLDSSAQTDSTVAKIIAENHEIIARKAGTFTAYQHEFRLGVGDGFFDTVAFPDTPHRPYSTAPAGATFVEQQGHSFLPHFFAEYNWTPDNKWSFGLQVDFFGFKWHNVTYQSGSDDPVSDEPADCYNYAVMGHFRYNWYRKNETWRVYSALHMGIDINTGSEIDMYGRQTELGIAFAPTLLGVQYGYKHFFVAGELGAHFALKDQLNLYSALSKLASISAGVRF
ncbi:MAG: hypothetical protein J5748_00275 [Bacteroidales bacterium]|nr:hypothetical protein [Bacteroidales bacterium]